VDLEITESYISKAHGFMIDLPDASWTIQEDEDLATGTLTLMLRPEGTMGQYQVTVRAAPLAEPTAPETIRDRTAEEVAKREEYSLKSKKAFHAAGRDAPGFVVDVDYPGLKIRAHQCYLVEGETQYSLSIHALVDEFDDYRPLLQRSWESFELIPVELTPEMIRERKLSELASRCGSEIEWAATWEEAAERAAREKKLVLVPVYSLGGFKISDEASIGPFMDPDIVNLVRERFVAFRYQVGTPAPFASQESYGLSATTFGSSVLIITPEAEVVGTTFSMEETSFELFLRRHLAKHPESCGPASPGKRIGLDLAAWHFRRGELDATADLLEEDPSLEARLMEAALLRRQREGEAGLEMIAKAREEGIGGLAADFSAEEARILMKLGRFEEAIRAWTRILEDHAESAQVQEARFQLGICTLNDTTKDETVELWNELIEEQEESRWAWKAAAMLKNPIFDQGLSGRLDWPPEHILAALEAPEFEMLPAEEARRAEQEAKDFLLRNQRADGSWISPTEVLATDDRPDEFTMNFTALCGQSLVPYCDEREPAEAVKKALDYLIAAREKVKALGEVVYFMDYTVYTKACYLWFITNCVEAGMGDRPALEPVIAELITEIGGKQKKGGGWSYYVTLDISKPDQTTNQSISFVTALNLIALIEARDAGFDVPDAIMDAGVSCLERMKNPDGTFEYFLFHDMEGMPRATPVPGAAGRGPLCTLTLLRAGRGGKASVRKALDLFLEHRHTYAKEKGKTLMHAGEHAQGSHYLMFDYAFAALAIESLPVEERDHYTQPVLEQILDARSGDGSYVDNPMLGWHYGTGMALMAFRRLLEPDS
jgi:tetratricopeptide (TPR) repeat protein